MPSARVHSLATLKDVKAALADFIDSVNQTLPTVDADLNRIPQWLCRGAPPRHARRRGATGCDDGQPGCVPEAHAAADRERRRAGRTARRPRARALAGGRAMSLSVAKANLMDALKQLRQRMDKA